jgi:type I restriction enzyme R subunit
LELKNSRKELSEGIRQNLTNQQPEYIQDFFTTVQFCFAGNDSQGLRYGTIGTPAKYYLNWKEAEADDTEYKLDKYIKKMCQKDRLIELMRDFVIFDAGVKKLPRPHQYFAVVAARNYVRDSRNGIIWHTQGSGKSITMVLLARGSSSIIPMPGYSSLPTAPNWIPKSPACLPVRVTKPTARKVSAIFNPAWLIPVNAS